MIDDVFMRRLRDQSFELSNQIYRFNFCLSSYIHPSYASAAISCEDEEVLKALFTSKRLEARLSRKLMQQYSLLGDYFFDFGRFDERIALMDPEAILKSAKAVGLALNFSRLAPYVTKSDVAKLVEQVGQTGYELAARHRQDFSEFDGKVEPSSLDQILDKATKDGNCCFSEWLYSQPLAIRKRTVLKFPKGMTFYRNSHADRYVPLFIKIAREYVPEWLLKEW